MCKIKAYFKAYDDILVSKNKKERKFNDDTSYKSRGHTILHNNSTLSFGIIEKSFGLMQKEKFSFQFSFYYNFFFKKTLLNIETRSHWPRNYTHSYSIDNEKRRKNIKMRQKDI